MKAILRCGIDVYRLTDSYGRVCFNDASRWCISDNDKVFEADGQIKEKELPPFFKSWEEFWDARKELIPRM